MQWWTEPKGSLSQPILIGKMFKPFGLQGWHNLVSYTDPLEAFALYNPCYLFRDGLYWPTYVLHYRTSPRRLVGQFYGIDTIDKAEQWRSEIFIERHQLAPSPDAQAYWCELEGASVYSIAGQFVGTVSHLFATGSNDVMVVNTPQNTQQFIPYLYPEVVKDFDREKASIIVDWL